MQILSKPEIEFAEELMRKGYLRAADSFSSIVRQPVSITATKIELHTTLDKIMSAIQKHADQVILITDIIGDIRGKGYLILTQEESRQLYQLCLAAFSDKAARPIAEDTVLKEVDNILSAAVISEFSDALGLNIFGDVPVLVQDSKLAAFDLTSESQENSWFLITTTSFIFNGLEKLKPSFLWKLNNDFLVHVRKAATLQ
jgi:chemotaxis protein CheY-P-specific phosphatase CheC